MAIIFNSVDELKYIKQPFRLPFDSKKPLEGNMVAILSRNINQLVSIVANPIISNMHTNYLRYYKPMIYTDKVFTTQIRYRMKPDELKELTKSLHQYKLSFYNKSAPIKNKNVIVDTTLIHKNFLDNCKGKSYINIANSYIDHLDYYLRSTCDGIIKQHNSKFFILNVSDWDINVTNKAHQMNTNHKLLNPISMIYFLMLKNPEALKKIEDYELIILDGSEGWFKFDLTDITPKKLRAFKTVFMKLKNHDIDLDAVTGDDTSQEEEEKGHTKAQAIAALRKEAEKEEQAESEKEKEEEPDADELDDDDEDEEEYHRSSGTVDDSEIPTDADEENALSEEEMEIARKALEDNHEDISRTLAGNKRLQMLREKEKSLKVNGVTIKELEENFATDVPIEEVDISDKLFTPVASVKKVKFNNMNKTYNEKMRTKDITSMFQALWNKKEMPAVIKSIEVKDSSDAMNLKETWHVTLETPDRITHSITVDLPKAYDNNYLYLGGNRKQFISQQMLKPLVKLNPTTVQICTNYNKIFMYRYGDILSPKVTVFKKVILAHPELFKVTHGNGVKLNGDHLTSIEYDSLAKDFISIELRGKSTGLMFNQSYFDNLRKEKKLDDINDKQYLYCAYDKRPTANYKAYVTLLDKESGDVGSDTSEGLSPIDVFVMLYKKETNKDFWELAGTKEKAGKRFMYSSCTIMGKKVPTILLVSYFEGLSKILHRANIKYRIADKRERITVDDRMIPFKDGYLIYNNDDIQAGLLLSGLTFIDTRAYNFTDFDNMGTYLDIFDALFNSRKLASALDAFYDNLIDPITEQILKEMDLPTDTVGLILAANYLLADNNFQNELSLTEFRIRNMEMISVYLYKQLANAYSNYKRKSMEKNPPKISIPKNAVIKEILTANTVEDINILNPIATQHKLNAITRKGPIGINVDEAYTEDKRAFDPTMIGAMTLSTSPDANCGVVRNMTVEPKVTGVRGYFDCDKKADDMNATNLFGYAEMLTPLGASGDEGIRTSMSVKQSSHIVPVKDMSPTLLSTGVERQFPYVTTKDYVIKAKENGKIKEVDEKNNMVLVEYKDGTHEAINLNPVISKNGGGGFYLSNKFTMNYKQGQSFKKDDILAQHQNFFSNNFDGCKFNLGTLCKCAIMSSFATFEDAKMITEGLSKRMASEIVMQKNIVLGPSATVSQIVKVGDKIHSGEPLITFEQSNDEKAINSMLKNIGEELKEDIRAIGRNSLNSKYTGTIEEVRIYSTEELENLSPSLQKIVKDYWNSIANKKKLIKKYNITDPTYQGNTFYEVNYPVRPDESGRVKGHKIDEGVIFEFYVKYEDQLKPGDKLCDEYALKGVIALVIPEGQEPYTPDEPDEPIETCFPSSSVLARMVPQVIKTMFIQKLLVYLRKHLLKMLEDKHSHATRVKMETYIYEVFTRMDKTKMNTDFYKAYFSKLSDKDFFAFFDKFAKDKNGYLTLNVEMFKNDPSMEEIEAAAKFMKVPLYEYVVQPYFSKDKGKPMVTPYPVPVGYIHEKRVQQMAIKKNSSSIDISMRDAKTNQVVGADKNGRNSIDENYAMVAYGAKNAVKEFMSFRSDDSVMKEEAYNQIRMNGYVEMSQLPDSVDNKTTLNTLDAYLISMGIKSDIVSPGYVLRSVQQGK